MSDWVRLHAALNDLPVGLLLASVVFDLLGAVMKKESLKAAGYWSLIGGAVGGGLAVVAGLMAMGRIPHGEATHAAMKTHQTFALVVLVFFGVLAIWRTARRGLLGKQEQTIFSTAGIIGVGLLLFTANLGGKLVFDRGMGIDGHVLQSAIEELRTAPVRDTVRVAPPESVRVLPDSTKRP